MNFERKAKLVKAVAECEDNLEIFNKAVEAGYFSEDRFEILVNTVVGLLKVTKELLIEVPAELE